jgi:hypothetical protein
VMGYFSDRMGPVSRLVTKVERSLTGENTSANFAVKSWFHE